MAFDRDGLKPNSDGSTHVQPFKVATSSRQVGKLQHALCSCASLDHTSIKMLSSCDVLENVFSFETGLDDGANSSTIAK